METSASGSGGARVHSRPDTKDGSEFLMGFPSERSMFQSRLSQSARCLTTDPQSQCHPHLLKRKRLQNCRFRATCRSSFQGSGWHLKGKRQGFGPIPKLQSPVSPAFLVTINNSPVRSRAKWTEKRMSQSSPDLTPFFSSPQSWSACPMCLPESLQVSPALGHLCFFFLRQKETTAMVKHCQTVSSTLVQGGS